MKKAILGLLLCFGVISLTGCGSATKTETKKCSITENGMSMEATFKAEKDKINNIEVHASMPTPSLGEGIDFSNITDTQKKIIQTQVESSIGIKEGDGVNVDFDLNEKEMVVNVKMDLKKADASVLTKLGIQADKDFSLKKTVENAENMGATCK